MWHGKSDKTVQVSSEITSERESVVECEVKSGARGDVQYREIQCRVTVAGTVSGARGSELPLGVNKGDRQRRARVSFWLELVKR